MSEAIPAPLLEVTIAGLQDLVHRLELDKQALERKISETRAAIGKLEHQLRHGRQPSKPRRKKGENLAAVRALFEDRQDLELTLTEIADRLDIPLTSAQTAVEKLEKSDVLEKTLDGTFRLTQPAAF